MKVLLNSVDKVKGYISVISLVECDVDLVRGRYVIDAKSLMGVLSLDLSKPIELIVHSENDEDAAMVFKSLESMGLIYHD